MWNLIKKYILLVLVMILAVMQPVSSSLANTGESQIFSNNTSSTSMGLFSRDGAVVGKVIGQVDGDRHIVYGRLSLLTPEGYRVYKTGKYYKIYGDTIKSREYLTSQIGKGIKAFGKLELVAGKSNAELLLANQITEYKPEDDSGTMDPAYSGNSGPFKWIGFTIAQGQYQVSNIEFKKSTDVINLLAHFTDPLFIEGRTIQTKTKGMLEETITYEPSTKTVFTIKDITEALTNGKNKFTPEKKDYIGTIRKFWQENIKLTWLMERSEEAYLQMSRSLQGYVFVTGQSGKANNLMENVKATRPDMDKFMGYIEQKIGFPKDFSKWASPAVFYGKIKGDKKKEVYLLTSPRPDKKYEGEYLNPVYTGPYYPEDYADTLVEMISEVKENSVPTIAPGDPEEQYRNIEEWPIGWQGEGSLYPGLMPKQYEQYSGQYVWMTGVRVLVYKIVTCDKEGCSTTIEHIERGELEEGTTTSGETTTTITLVGHYIKPDHIIIKPQYNYLLNLIKEISFKGGV